MAVLSLRSLPFFSCLHVIIILLSKTSGQVVDKYYCDKDLNDRGNYTTNSTYDTNLKTLLSTITSNTESNNFGFYNLSYGQDTDKVYAIGMCRADIKTDNCNTCLNKARINLTQVCKNRKEAIGWYDDETCMLRYSDRTILYEMEITPGYFAWNGPNATTADEFNENVRTLMTGLTSEAASGNSSIKYATGTKDGPNNQTIYGLVQCTPDISRSQCSSCLNDSLSKIPDCCNNRLGAREVTPSCILRYDANALFYDPEGDAPPPPTTPTPTPTPDAPPPTTPTPTPGKSNNLPIYIGVGVSIVVLSFILISFIVWKRRKRFQTELDSEIEPVETLQFTFETIRVATNNFSEENMLGEGGFGPVYKGKLSNGQEIAVKRLSMNSAQGDTEFKNEVQLVAKLQHRNLVRLFGFSLEKRERLLVYEFVPNKSLDYFIFDPIKRVNLDWETRYKIIGGIAKGLLYLHEDSRLRIIHRDLKASNILLDAEMNAKISDFGMARLIVMDQTQGNTNKVVGTYGYMAPEYVLQGHFSVKSDVFSFGVLALEIVCGQKNSSFLNGEHEDDLLSFAWKNWKDGTASNMIDPTINNGSRHEIMRCIHIGLLCVQENLTERPTMASVVLMLNSYSTTLPVPSEPAFFMQSRVVSDIPSWDYNSNAVESTYPNEGVSTITLNRI